eukprot:2333400-Rhodomonas_salina.5
MIDKTTANFRKRGRTLGCRRGLLDHIVTLTLLDSSTFNFKLIVDSCAVVCCSLDPEPGCAVLPLTRHMMLSTKERRIARINVRETTMVTLDSAQVAADLVITHTPTIPAPIRTTFDLSLPTPPRSLSLRLQSGKNQLLSPGFEYAPELFHDC